MFKVLEYVFLAALRRLSNLLSPSLDSSLSGVAHGLEVHHFEPLQPIIDMYQRRQLVHRPNTGAIPFVQYDPGFVDGMHQGITICERANRSR